MPDADSFSKLEISTLWLRGSCLGIGQHGGRGGGWGGNRPPRDFLRPGRPGLQPGVSWPGSYTRVFGAKSVTVLNPFSSKPSGFI